VKVMAGNHSVSMLVVHAVGATADRSGVLPASRDDWLAGELRRAATELGAVVLAAGNTADHVHVVLQYPPRVAVATLVGRLKGASSRAAHVSGVMGYDDGWQGGYWAESVGVEHIEPLLEYVAHQRAHHASDTTLEPWQHPYRTLAADSR